ncbi:hypothetical protein [Dickeya oryzae]|uniref:hypothetical protein n=1 Tax=Dickeya oryzae TaxID=1240404 RepID=UPI003B967F90
MVIFFPGHSPECYLPRFDGSAAWQTIFTGMTSPNQVWHAILSNIEVLLLQIFMITGNYSNKRLLSPRSP